MPHADTLLDEVCLVVVKFSLKPVMSLSCFALFLVYLCPASDSAYRGVTLRAGDAGGVLLVMVDLVHTG